MLPSDQVPPGQDMLLRRLDDLERRVRELQASRGLEAATIGAGGLLIKDGGQVQVEDDAGSRIIRLGKVPFGDGSTRPGMVAFRSVADGGQVAMSLYDGIFAVWDRTPTIVMSTDESTGQGLATPYIPLNGWPTRLVTTLAGESTSSVTFTPLWTVQGHKQHPRVRIGVWARGSDATTAGELILRDTSNAVIIAGPVAVPANVNNWYELIGSVAGAHMASIKLDVEVRRTAGAGLIHTHLGYMEGIQSP